MNPVMEYFSLSFHSVWSHTNQARLFTAALRNSIISLLNNEIRKHEPTHTNQMSVVPASGPNIFFGTKQRGQLQF
jgi:hypothetical protein